MLYSAKFKGIPMCSINGQVNPMWYILTKFKAIPMCYIRQNRMIPSASSRLPEVLFSADAILNVFKIVALHTLKAATKDRFSEAAGLAVWWPRQF